MMSQRFVLILIYKPHLFIYADKPQSLSAKKQSSHTIIWKLCDYAYDYPALY